MGSAEGTMEQYLAPTAVLDFGNEMVKSFAEDAVGDSGDPRERAVGLFLAVRDGIVYDTQVPFHRAEHYRASEIIPRSPRPCDLSLDHFRRPLTGQGAHQWCTVGRRQR